MHQVGHWLRLLMLVSVPHGSHTNSSESTFRSSFSSLSYDRSKASSKASSPHSAIQSFLFQICYIIFQLLRPGALPSNMRYNLKCSHTVHSNILIQYNRREQHTARGPHRPTCVHGAALETFTNNDYLKIQLSVSLTLRLLMSYIYIYMTLVA